MAGDEGFEPPITGPEPVALPLGQSPLNQPGEMHLLPRTTDEIILAYSFFLKAVKHLSKFVIHSTQ